MWGVYFPVELRLEGLVCSKCKCILLISKLLQKKPQGRNDALQIYSNLIFWILKAFNNIFYFQLKSCWGSWDLDDGIISLNLLMDKDLISQVQLMQLNISWKMTDIIMKWFIFYSFNHTVYYNQHCTIKEVVF